MSKLQDLLKCPMCKETFTSSPIILSCCGATVCEHHINVILSSVNTLEAEKLFTCPLCKECYDVDTSKTKFTPNKTVEQLLDMEICKEINLGDVYKTTSNEIESLETSFKELADFVKDPSHFIHEHVSGLRRSVNLRKEKLKAKLDEICSEMNRKLDVYQIECDEHLRHANLEEKTHEIFKECQMNIAEWTKNKKRILLVSSDAKRKEIQSKAIELDTKLFDCLEELEDTILMREDKVWSYLENDKVVKEYEKELILFER